MAVEWRPHFRAWKWRLHRSPWHHHRASPWCLRRLRLKLEHRWPFPALWPWEMAERVPGSRRWSPTTVTTVRRCPMTGVTDRENRSPWHLALVRLARRDQSRIMAARRRRIMAMITEREKRNWSKSSDQSFDRLIDWLIDQSIRGLICTGPNLTCLFAVKFFYWTLRGNRRQRALQSTLRNTDR